MPKWGIPIFFNRGATLADFQQFGKISSLQKLLPVYKALFKNKIKETYIVLQATLMCYKFLMGFNWVIIFEPLFWSLLGLQVWVVLAQWQAFKPCNKPTFWYFDSSL